MDFFFLSTKQEKDSLTCLALADCTSGGVAACGSPTKSGVQAPYLVEFVVYTVTVWGYQDIILHTDGKKRS